MRKTHAKIIEDLSQNQPYIPFTFRELVAIDIIISGYARYIHAFSQSTEKEKRLDILSNVNRRLQTQLCILAQGRSTQLILAYEEVAELLAAMEEFIEQTQCSLSLNDEQAHIIRSVNCWRLRLLESAPEHYA